MHRWRIALRMPTNPAIPTPGTTRTSRPAMTTAMSLQENRFGVGGAHRGAACPSMIASVDVRPRRAFRPVV